MNSAKERQAEVRERCEQRERKCAKGEEVKETIFLSASLAI